MGKRSVIFILFIFLFFIAPSVRSEEADVNINIKVSLFKGTWDEGQKGIEKEFIMKPSSHPEMAYLKDKASSQEQEYIAAVMETLIEVMDLQTVEELGGLEGHEWFVTETSFHSILEKKGVAFQFVLAPIRISSTRLSLKTVVTRTKDSYVDSLREKVKGNPSISAVIKGYVDKIYDRELMVNMDEPVIVGIPYKDFAYFISILIPSLGCPKPIHKVMPVYPEELKEEGIGGEVDLKVKVNAWGEVGKVEVTKSLHPYLDFAAVMALKKWKFEPFFRGGRPVPAKFIYKVNFNPEAEAKRDTGTKESPERPENYSQEMVNILKECAKYCEKLNKAALDFICKEKIHDIYYGPDPKRKNTLMMGGESIKLIDGSYINLWTMMSKPFYGSWKIERNRYISDYFLVKKGQEIKEKRILLKENSRQVPAQKEYLLNERFSGLKPFLAPGRVLGKERQELFSFSIINKRENLYIIEAVPVSTYAEAIEYARIWIDKQNFQILKMEIKGIPLEGYNEVLDETTEHNVKPEFITTYSYKMEKSGLLFPDKVKVLVRYPMHPEETTFYKAKIKTNIDYNEYQFFTVKTEADLDKKEDR